MASNIKIKNSTANTMLDAITTAIGASGLLRIYSGTQPADAGTALSGNTLLAELALSATFAAAASAGVLTASAISDDVSADATGTATWATFVTAAGVRILDVSVGTSGADINLNTTSIVTGARVSVTSYTLTIA